MVNEFRAGYNYDNSKRQSTFTAADVASSSASRTRRAWDTDRLGFPSFQFTGADEPAGPTSIADAGRNVDRTLRQNAFSLSDNLTLDQGRALAEGGRPLDPQHGERWVRLRREFPRAVSIPRGGRDRESVHRLPSRHAVRRPGPRHEPRAPRWLLQRRRDVRAGRLEGQQERDPVPGAALRGRGRLARGGRNACELPAG